MGRRKATLQKTQSRNRSIGDNGDPSPRLPIRVSTEYYSSEMTLENRFTSFHPSVKGNGDTATACGSSKSFLASKSLGRGEILDTLLREPYATLRELDKGFDLNDIPDNFGCYEFPWNARSYANKMSTQFSSFRLTEGLENFVGNSDFVSDWENIKSLITSRFDTNSRSVLLHKVGKSIFVDEFDLKTLFGPKLYSADWSWLENYARGVTGKHKDKIVREGKSPQNIYAKAAFHKLLYFGVEQNISVQKLYYNEHSWEPPYLPPPPECNLQGSETKFLNRMKWNFGDYSMLLGTNIPVFNRKGGTHTSTLISQDSDIAEKIELEIGLDAWLNNMLMGANETLLTCHKDGIVDGTKWIKTTSLPQEAGFDAEKLVEERDGSVFDFLKTHVVENGNTYWFYKAPGSSKFALYNLTKLSKDTNFPKTEKAPLDVKDGTNPYELAFASLLFRCVNGCKKSLRLTTMESMLKHAISLAGPNHSELCHAANYLLADVRVPTCYRFDKSIVRLLNGDLQEPLSGKSFNYNWHGETSLSSLAMESVNQESLELAALLCLEKVTTNKATTVMEELDKEYDVMSDTDNDSKEKVHAEETSPSVLIIHRRAKEQIIQVLKRPSETPCASLDLCLDHLNWPAENDERKCSKGRCSAEDGKLKKYTAKIRKDKSKQRQQHLQEMNRPAVGEDFMKLLKPLDKIKINPARKSMKPSDWILTATCSRLTCELVPMIKWLIACTDVSPAKIGEEHLKYQQWLYHAKCKLGQVLRLLSNWRHDDDVRHVVSNLAVTLLHTPPASSEENRKERSILNMHLANVMSNCIASHLFQFDTWIREKEDNLIFFEQWTEVATESADNIKDILCQLWSHTGSANPYKINFPVVPSIPRVKNNELKYREWSLKVIQHFDFTNLLTHTSDSEEAKDVRNRGALSLLDAANVITRSLTDIHTDVSDVNHYQNLRELLLSALNLYDAAFEMFAYNALSPNSAFSTALEMVSLYSVIRRHCAKDMYVFKIVDIKRELFSTSDSFRMVEKRLLQASQMHACRDGREELFNQSVWELSSLHLTQAFFRMESLPEISEDMNESSYKSVLEHLESAKTYIDQIKRSTKCELDYAPDKQRSRRALINSVIADIFRKKILMVVEKEHGRFKDLTSTWEPFRPDVIEHIVRAKYVSYGRVSNSSESQEDFSRLQPLKDLLEAALKNYGSVYSKYKAISDPFQELSEFLRMKDVETFHAVVIDGKNPDDVQSLFEYFVELLPKVQNLNNKWTNDSQYKQNLDINWNNLYEHKDEEWQKPESFGSKDYCLNTAPFPVLFRIIIRLWKHFGKKIVEDKVDDPELILFAKKIQLVFSQFQVKGTSEDDLLSLSPLSYTGVASFHGIGYQYGNKEMVDFSSLLLDLEHLLQIIRVKGKGFVEHWKNDKWLEMGRTVVYARKRSKSKSVKSIVLEGQLLSAAFSNLSMGSQKCFTDTDNDCKILPETRTYGTPEKNRMDGFPTVAQETFQEISDSTLIVTLTLLETDEAKTVVAIQTDEKENSNPNITTRTSGETETLKQDELDTAKKNLPVGPSKKKNKKSKHKRKK